MLFLDFETGTTIDNAYAVTGIKHSLSPGKFTTSLTLSYGDVYGKYENAATSLAKAISESKKSKGDQATEDVTDSNVVDIEEFVDETLKSGIKIIYVHARNAILNGFSPQANRTIPPLNYDYVRRIKK